MKGEAGLEWGDTPRPAEMPRGQAMKYSTERWVC